jgi:hypothetical protein
VAIVAATTGRTQTVDLPYGETVQVLDYEMTFIGPEAGPEGRTAFRVELNRPGRVSSEILRPRMYRMFGSGQMQMRAEPEIRRRLTGDLYVAPAQYLPPAEALAETGEVITLTRGESREVGGITYTFLGYDMTPHGTDGDGGTAMPGSIGARVRVEKDGESDEIVPIMTVGRETVTPHAAMPLPYGWGGTLRLQSIDADAGAVTLLRLTGDAPVDGRAEGGLLTVEVSEKPLMSILWTGVILALLGGALAAWRRALQVRPA